MGSKVRIDFASFLQVGDHAAGLLVGPRRWHSDAYGYFLRFTVIKSIPQ